MRLPWHHVLLIGALVLLLAAPSAMAGTRLLVSWSPGGNQTYLNDQILGDTLANGTRRDSSCTYILQRGGLYYLNRTITTRSWWGLNIVAQDSAGNIPLILMDTQPGTSRPPGTFALLNSNLYLQNLEISGFNELVPANLGGLQGQFFNTGSKRHRIVVDSCIFTNINGQFIRTDQDSNVIILTNSTLANMGFLGTSNFGAGKALDVRAGYTDSLVVVNNTFVNSQDRIIRHFQSTNIINYLLFDHNTVVNGMSYHGLLSLGRMGARGIITNNLLVDAFALGNDTDAVRQAEFTDSRELDAFGFARMSWVIANPDSAFNTFWTIHKNYYVVSDSGQAFFTYASSNPIVANPPLTAGNPLTYFINGKLGADSATAFQSATVNLNNTPNLMMAMLKWYRRPFNTVDSGAGKTKQTTYFTLKNDYDRRGYRYLRDTMDCAYSTSSPLYTAADGGLPVGALTWFGMTPTGVSTPPGVPSEFSLLQNYPNPFNPSTKISFTLGKSAYTTLTVYNILGQRVSTLLAGAMSAGSHEVTFDAKRLSSGVYFYRLESGAQVAVKKMMLLK